MQSGRNLDNRADPRAWIKTRASGESGLPRPDVRSRRYPQDASTGQDLVNRRI